AGQPDRERDGGSDDRGSTQVSEQGEKRQHDEDRAEEDGTTDAAERGLDERGLVVDDTYLDAGWQRPSDVVQGGTDPGGDGDRVGAELLDDPACDHLSVEPVGDAAPARGTLSHVVLVPE